MSGILRRVGIFGHLHAEIMSIFDVASYEQQGGAGDLFYPHPYDQQGGAGDVLYSG